MDMKGSDWMNEVTEKAKFRPWIERHLNDQEESIRLQKEYDIPEEFLTYSMDKDESARIDYDEDTNTLLIIFDVPFRDEQKTSIYSSGPMSFIIKSSVIVTSFSNEHMRNAFSDRFRNSLDPQLKTRFVLLWLLEITSQYLNDLRVLNKMRVKIEQSLGTTPKNKDLMELMRIERSLIFFIMSLKSNFIVISKIQSGRYLTLYEEDDEILDDLTVEIEQGIDMATISNRILNEMTDSYSAIISNSMNSVMKFLTIYSLILTIPTIIFSFYGMNVPLPFDDNGELSWVIITVLAFLLSGIAAYMFNRIDRFK